MNPGEFKLTATGDSFITRRLSPGDTDAAALAELMGEADVRFTNLEVVVRRTEGFPSAQSGGTWATTGPESLDDLRRYGFNLLTWANNHTLDYSHGGLLATRDNLERKGWAHAGAGRDLPEAASPAFLDCAGGRVACLAAASSFHESWIAGNPRPDVSGRPGVNPLRFAEGFRVSRKRIKEIQVLAEACGINERRNLRVKEGFDLPDPSGTVRFGSHLFEEVGEGGEEGMFTRAHAGDLERLHQGVAAARRTAGLVLVSLHSHEMRGNRKDHPADFLIEAARSCIDAGADAVIGHGPHILRGVEVYRGRPIFYSLGNFIFQNESVPYQPADFYEQYRIDSSATGSEAMRVRSQSGRVGLGMNPKVWHSVVARWTMRKGVLAALEFYPISLGFGKPPEERGWPKLTDVVEPLVELKRLSEEFGTQLEIDGGVARWSGR